MNVIDRSQESHRLLEARDTVQALGIGLPELCGRVRRVIELWQASWRDVCISLARGSTIGAMGRDRKVRRGRVEVQPLMSAGEAARWLGVDQFELGLLAGAGLLAVIRVHGAPHFHLRSLEQVPERFLRAIS